MRRDQRTQSRQCGPPPFRPSNVTGAVTLNVELGSKRLELLREVVPTDTIVVVLANPTNPNFEGQLRDLQAAARTVGQPILVATAETEGDIDAAFAAWSNSGREQFLS